MVCQLASFLGPVVPLISVTNITSFWDPPHSESKGKTKAKQRHSKSNTKVKKNKGKTIQRKGKAKRRHNKGGRKAKRRGSQEMTQDESPRQPKEYIFHHLVPCWGHLGTILGNIWVILGVFVVLLEQFWSWPILAQLAPSWGLELSLATWGHLGPPWGHLGTKSLATRTQVVPLFLGHTRWPDRLLFRSRAFFLATRSQVVPSCLGHTRWFDLVLFLSYKDRFFLGHAHPGRPLILGFAAAMLPSDFESCTSLLTQATPSYSWSQARTNCSLLSLPRKSGRLHIFGHPPNQVVPLFSVACKSGAPLIVGHTWNLH